METPPSPSQNLSVNESGDSSKWMTSTLATANIILDVLILLVSVSGNLLVIVTIVREKKLQTTCHFLLLHLSVCDISLVLVSIPFDIYFLVHDNQWNFGSVFCKLLWPINTMLYISGPLILTVISVDRYRVFVQTFKAKLSRGQVKRTIVVVYIFSLVCVIPYSFILTMKGNRCSEEWPKLFYRQLYTVVLFCVQYALPLTIMCAIYTNIGVHLTRKTQRVRLSRHGRSSRVSLHGSESRTPDMEARKQRNRKALRMIMIVVIVFAVFMLPFQLIWLIADLRGGIDPEQLAKLSKLFVIFSYVGSCTLNPFIYGVADTRFRKGYRSVLNKLVRVVTKGKPALTEGSPQRNLELKRLHYSVASDTVFSC